MTHQNIPWPEDEHGTGSIAREYPRSWQGMPLRHIWNNSPDRSAWKVCTSCGYKWSETDFTYCGTMRNGVQEYPKRHAICWNCWMCETEPHQVRKFWESRDRNDAPAKPAGTGQSRMKKIGEGM